MSNSLDDYEVSVRIPDDEWNREAAAAFALLAVKMLGEHMPHLRDETYEILNRALAALSVPFANEVDVETRGRGDMTAAGALYCLLGKAAVLDQSYSKGDRDRAAEMRRKSIILYKDACGPVDS